MKAVRISEYGTNDVVQIVDAEIPQPKAGEVLVKVQTAGINPIDWKIRSGAGKRIGLELPIMLGGEIVGTVAKVGDSVTNFKVGDVIYGMVKVGGFAEFVAAKASDVALKPKGLGDQEAAGIPLCGLTAWQAIFDLANLRQGQTILITGASGAVGSLAVQFAKFKGARVIGTASGKNEEFVRSLGADEFINYEKERFEEIAKVVDVVFDTVGGETFAKSFQTLKKAGVLVTSVALPNAEETRELEFDIKRVFCKPDGDQLNQISQLFEAGKLKARVSSVLPLAEVKEALALSESGKANGKVVLQIAT